MKRTQFLMRCDGVARGLGVARPPDMHKLLTHQQTLDPMLCPHHGHRRRRQEHLRSRAPSTKVARERREECGAIQEGKGGGESTIEGGFGSTGRRQANWRRRRSGLAGGDRRCNLFPCFASVD
jgi:hypothetical protein